ncbi:MAG: hypothetical protein IJX16_00250 [Clostridia bacterium]|nr:hypothetical protein [Clostridia bacterium]
MITRNGVCYDLNISSYRCKVDNLTFVFSSKLHLDKFKKKYKENRDIVNYSLTKRFNINVDVSQLADVVLYRKIETRGFLIVTATGEELCQNQMVFVGGKVTPPNYND